jgi:hypothetical protein
MFRTTYLSKHIPDRLCIGAKKCSGLLIGANIFRTIYRNKNVVDYLSEQKMSRTNYLSKQTCAGRLWIGVKTFRTTYRSKHVPDYLTEQKCPGPFVGTKNVPNYLLEQTCSGLFIGAKMLRTTCPYKKMSRTNYLPGQTCSGRLFIGAKMFRTATNLRCVTSQKREP